MVALFLSVFNWVQQAGQTLISLLKCLVFARKISPYPERPTKDLVILGNGPSLSKTLTEDLEKLKSYDLMAVNLFACAEAHKQIQPNHYVWLDPAFVEPEHPAGAKARQALVDHTHWPLTLWVPTTFTRSKDFVDQISQNPQITLHYFNYVICDGFPAVIYPLFRWGWGMPQCQNVLISALFLGIQAGFEKIWLTGADHTWHEDIRLNEQNELQYYDTHFYEKEKNITGSSSTELKTSSHLSRVFLSLHKVYRGYEVLLHYANSRRVTVLNASKKSYIDVFPKLPLP